MIKLLIVFVIFYFIYLIAVSPKVYKKINLIEINKFLDVLIYRGYADDWLLNSFIFLHLYKYKFEAEIYLVKYRERGAPGIYIQTKINQEFAEKEELLIKKITDKRLRYKILERVPREKIYFIDMKRDYELIKEMIEFIWDKIFEMEMRFRLYFYNICLNPNKILDFEDRKELEEKGIDIRIPVVTWQWLLQKIGLWK